MKFSAVITVCLLLVTLYQGGSAQQCGIDVGGTLCSGGLCCSKWGFCGTTDAHCGDGCQSQCDGGSGGGGGGGGGSSSTGPIAELIPEEIFDEMLKHRNNPACPARGFYTYDAFINATNKFPEFGNTGDNETRKREVAAFLAHTSHVTTGGWPSAPDGPYAWGYCFKLDVFPGSNSYSRSPSQLSWNYNYRQAGRDLGLGSLNNANLVATDSLNFFTSALKFWTTPQFRRPSCHDVITDSWLPTSADLASLRIPGFGVTINVINGALECGRGPDERAVNRIGFYKRYCNILGIDHGDNVDCSYQRPFIVNSI